jgi:predicted oxidoreductase
MLLAPGGPELSRIALGCWRLADENLGPHDVAALIEASLDVGVTTFDHADIYGDYRCEALFGAALAERQALRDSLQIVTKCGIKLVSPARPAHTLKHYDTSAAHILASVDNSLRVLGVERIDVLLIHRPDPLMDADEVAAAFTQLRDSGKVRHFGVSNFTPSECALLASRLAFPLVTNQIEFSPLELGVLDDGTLDYCQRERITPMAWSPFAGGRLFSDASARAVRVREALAAIGASLGATIAEVALAWIMTHPARLLPVIGTCKRERVRATAAAVDLRLSREQWFAVWCASQGREVP